MPFIPKYNEPFNKLIEPIKDIENHTKCILEYCREIAEIYPKTAEEIGNKITKKSVETLCWFWNDLSIKNKFIVASIGLLGQSASTVGEKMAQAKNEIEKFKLRKKIECQINKTRKKIYPFINDTIIDYKSASKKLENKIYSIGNVLIACSNAEEIVIKDEIEKLKCLLQDFFQNYYRLALLEKALFYYDNFKEKIKNLEEFAIWYPTEIIVNKLICYKQAYDKIYSSMLSMATSDNQRKTFDNAFNILSGEAPALAFFDIKPTDALFNEINRKLSAEERNKKFKPQYPSFYYFGSGFQEIYKLCKEHFETVKENDYRGGLIGIVLLCIVSLLVNGCFLNNYLSPFFTLSSLLIIAFFILWGSIRKKVFFDNPVKKIKKYQSYHFFADIGLLVKKHLDEECIIASDNDEHEKEPKTLYGEKLEIVNIIKKYDLNPINKPSYYPDISYDTKEYLVQNVDKNISLDSVVAVFDTTIFDNSCKNGIIFTTNGIYNTERWESTEYVKYSDIKKITLEGNEITIFKNNGDILVNANLAIRNRQALRYLLTELVNRVSILI